MSNRPIIQDALNRIRNVINHGVPEGARSVPAFSVAEHPTNKVNQFIVKAGSYVFDGWIFWLDEDASVSTVSPGGASLTKPTTGDRQDLVYLDISHDTGAPSIFVQEGNLTPPVPDPGHTIMRLWTINRINNDEEITNAMLDADSLKEKVGDNVNKFILKAGSYRYKGQIATVVSDTVISEASPGVPLTTPVADRNDLVYFDYNTNTGTFQVYVTEGSLTLPADNAWHVNMPIGDMHRLAGNSAITAAMLVSSPDTFNINPNDHRIIAAALPHSHTLAEGAYDVDVGYGDINQVIGGGLASGDKAINHVRFTAARLVELCESNPTGADLNSLVSNKLGGGSRITLHLHNYIDTVHSGSGDAVSDASAISIIGSGAVSTTGSGSTITVSVDPRIFISPADRDLDMNGYHIVGLPDKAELTDPNEAATVDYVNDAIANSDTSISGAYVKYEYDVKRDKDIDMCGPAMAGTHTIINVKDPVNDHDVANKIFVQDQLNDQQADHDVRYKLGHPDGINAEAAGHVSMHEYQIKNVADPSEDKDAVPKLWAQAHFAPFVHNLSAHQVDQDLFMSHPGALPGDPPVRFNIKNLASAVEQYDAVNLKDMHDYVVSQIPAPAGGDNMGDCVARAHVDFQGTYKGINHPSPSAPTDLVNKEYVDNIFATVTAAAPNKKELVVSLEEGGTLEVWNHDPMIGGGVPDRVFHISKDAHGNNQIIARSRIQEVLDPILAQDVATKAYVDKARETSTAPGLWIPITPQNGWGGSLKIKSLGNGTAMLVGKVTPPVNQSTSGNPLFGTYDASVAKNLETFVTISDTKSNMSDAKAQTVLNIPEGTRQIYFKMIRGDGNFDNNTDYHQSPLYINVVVPIEGGSTQPVVNLTLRVPWTNLNLTSGSVQGLSGFAPQYCVDAMNFVHLRGVIRESGSSTTLATLPSQYAPSLNSYFLASSMSSHVIVTSGGAFTTATPQAGRNQFLDGITWYADQAPPVIGGADVVTDFYSPASGTLLSLHHGVVSMYGFISCNPAVNVQLPRKYWPKIQLGARTNSNQYGGYIYWDITTAGKLTTGTQQNHGAWTTGMQFIGSYVPLPE